MTEQPPPPPAGPYPNPYGQPATPYQPPSSPYQPPATPYQPQPQPPATPYQPTTPYPPSTPYQPTTPGPAYPQYGMPVPPPPSNDNKRSLIIVGGIVAALIVVCLVVGLVYVFVHEDDPKTTGSPTTTSAPAATGTVDGPKGQPEGTSAAPDLPGDKTYTGSGDKVIKVTLTGDYVHIARITSEAGGYFSIKSLDGHGKMLDILVSHVGVYSGTVLMDIDDDEGDIKALEISADGAWRLDIGPLDKAPQFTGSASGKGDAVLVVPSGTLNGLATAKMTHKGKSNFIVKAHGGPYPDLLVNAIGNYDGEVVLPEETTVIEIIADGSWTIKVE
jgi:hypothetical protein